MNLKPIILLSVFFLSVSILKAQEVKVIKFGQLESILKQEDKPMIINFWATWCRPCIKEMPYFEGLKASLQSQGKDFEVILVSLDDVELLDTKVLPFAQKRELKSQLYLLDETDYNEIIDKIDPKWSGAIPATIFIDNKKKKREFHEKEFEKEDLENIVKQFLNS